MWPKKIMIIFSKFDDFFSEKENIATQFLLCFFKFLHILAIFRTQEKLWLGWVGLGLLEL
jgi:hypothetical protein